MSKIPSYWKALIKSGEITEKEYFEKVEPCHILIQRAKERLISGFLKTMRRMKNILEYCKNHPDVYSEFDAVGDLWNVYKEEYGKWEQRRKE